MKTNLKLIAIFFSAAMITACSTTPKQSKTAPAATSAAAVAPAATPAPVPTAQAAQKSTADVSTCKRTSEERSLEIETLQPKGCKLWYSKFGNRDAVASSSVGTTHCETVRGRIEENLKGAGFQCQK